jgi:hypothetical protein
MTRFATNLTLAAAVSGGRPGHKTERGVDTGAERHVRGSRTVAPPRTVNEEPQEVDLGRKNGSDRIVFGHTLRLHPRNRTRNGLRAG